MSSFHLNRGLEPLTGLKTFKFASWDIEASDWWTLQLIGLWDGENYYHFKTVPEFITFAMQDKYRDWRFFAHFGGRYDLNFIFDWLRTQSNITCEFYTSGSLVIQMTLKSGSRRIKLCDSYRLFYMPGNDSQTRTDNKAGLKSLGVAFNVEHQKTEMDFGNVGYNKETIEYNEQDCRCLYEVIDRFFVETGIQSETFATHALRVWRKDFLKQTIWKPGEDVLALARQTYHGGRVEVFKRQSESVFAYDVNSMYPYVMQFEMPTEYVGESQKLTDKYYGFVDCTIYIPESYIPILPLRRDKLYFPVGTLRGQWTSEELIAAELQGCTIQKIHQAYYFKTVEIFKDYVLKLYELKKKSGEPTRTIAKGLLNALYGKFGQNPTKKIYCSERTAPDGAYPIILSNGTPSGFAYYERTSRSAYLLPHLASAVTSKARLHLFTKLDNNSFYCDTDSVFTSESIQTSKELGEWSEVGQGAAQFIQPKLYKFKGTWKSKGLNKEQNIDDFIAGNANMGKRSRSIKEAMRQDTDACSHVHVQKLLRETHPKRSPDGENDTRPWNIEELRK